MNLLNKRRMKLFKNFNFDKLKTGLTKTRQKLFDKISETFTGKAVVDDELIDQVEEILVSSDIGIDLTDKIIDDAKKNFKDEKDRSPQVFINQLKKSLSKYVIGTQEKVVEFDSTKKPYVILIVGVNGAGKTTTIGKLALNYRKSGLKVLICAADTFRAAANEQLDVWAERAGVKIIMKGKNADPSSVAYESVQYAIDNNYDIVLIDTAGRLQTKTNLMEELNKLNRVVKKKLEHAPNETLLVIDGNTGQNGLQQAKEFSKFVNISGLIITKLDGTAKGGIVFQISSQIDVPIKYIGVGEGIEDLQDFDINQFVDAIFNK